MGISIFVMPVSLWVRGAFRVGWEGEGESRPRRSEEEGALAAEFVRDAVETLAGVRCDWDESAPLKSATTLSAYGFARPFLRARSWAYRAPLPRLCELEPPQLWIPAVFEPVLPIALPHGVELSLVSAPKLAADFDRILELLAKESPMEEIESLPEGSPLPGPLAEFWDEVQTTRRLRDLARLGVEERIPVIVES